MNDEFMSLLVILLTVASYFAGKVVYDRHGHNPLIHPIITAAIPICIAMWLLDISYGTFHTSTKPIQFLLGPAIVALAIPLHRQMNMMLAASKAILLTLLAGASVATVSAVLIAWLLGMNKTLLITVAPKTVTSPIAMEIARLSGGYITLAAGIVILVGVISAASCPFFFKHLGITDHRVQGFTLGLTGHGVGTAKAFEISPVAGAYASLAMSLTGLLLALTLPAIINSFVG